MFGIGSLELVVIAVVALMLFSPRELPAIIRSVSKFWGQLRATADDFRDAIMNEEELEEIKKVYKGTHAELKRAESSARREVVKARMQMRQAQQKLATVNRASQAHKQRTTSDDAESSGPAADRPVAASSTPPAKKTTPAAAAKPPAPPQPSTPAPSPRVPPPPRTSVPGPSASAPAPSGDGRSTPTGGDDKDMSQGAA